MYILDKSNRPEGIRTFFQGDIVQRAVVIEHVKPVPDRVHIVFAGRVPFVSIMMRRNNGKLQ
jgi:hypothetical protein